MIKHFEFWNTHVFHFPIYIYWLYLSCKARSLFFFSAANPGIETGGLVGESKFKILQSIDNRYLPKTIFYASATSVNNVLTDIANANIQFPFVVKPDVGQGGWLIDMIHDTEDLQTFLTKIKMPFMIQEFVSAPVELGILYYRFPGKESGKISSIAVKDLLCVVGDGKSNIKELLEQHPRGKNQFQKFKNSKRIKMNRVPAQGECVRISFIGNHSYGTKFLNGNRMIDSELTQRFDSLSKNIKGFYFGRFDIMCESIEDLKAGNFKILELNGVGAEPLHIFDPTESLWNAYHTAFNHWNIIFQISKMNKGIGVCYMKLREALKILKQVKRIQQIHNTNFTIGN